MKYKLISLIFLGLVACGQNQGDNSTCQNNCSSNRVFRDINVDFNAQLSGGVHDETQTILDNDDFIQLRLPITGTSYIKHEQNSYSLSELSGAELHFIENGTQQIELKIPRRTLFQPNNLPKVTNKLPNGENLPHLAYLTPGYFDIQFEETTIRIYHSPGHLGLFVTTPFDPFVESQFSMINQNNLEVGYLNQIPALTHFQGGYLATLKHP